MAISQPRVGPWGPGGAVQPWGRHLRNSRSTLKELHHLDNLPMTVLPRAYYLNSIGGRARTLCATRLLDMVSKVRFGHDTCGTSGHAANTQSAALWGTLPGRRGKRCP